MTDVADAGRVERWARDLCRLDGIDPDQEMSDGGTPWWTAYRDNALGVIALADAERAAGRPTWRSYGWPAEEPPKDVCFDVWAYGRRVVDCYYNGYQWRTYADGERDDEHVPGVTAYIVAEDGPIVPPSTRLETTKAPPG